MQVQELFDTEVDRQHPECNSKSLELIKELGLTGQEELYKTNENKITEAVFPFNIASNEQVFTYRFNFPNTSELVDYKEPIPLRVLEILKKAKDTDKFDNFQIWSKPDGSYRLDPVLVGFIKRGEYTFDIYLLATWGDAIEEYSSLLKKAITGWREELVEEIKTAELKLASMKAKALNKLPKLGISRYNNKWTVAIPNNYGYIMNMDFQ